MDYDIEIDKLVNLLFPEGIPNDYEDNAEFYEYLNKLGSYKIEQFSKEMKLLAEEKSSVDGQTKQLVSSNYKSFIETADCSRSIYSNVCSIEDNVRAFLNETPKLLDNSEKFIEVSNEIREKRRKNNLIVSSSNEILQILEIPHFMNSCIRNEYYEEALLLPSFIKRLTGKHGDIPLINCIVKDVENSWSELQRHLLNQLITDISLPKCLQIIGYLRRMNVFTDTELRLQFLQARGTWFDSLLAAVPSDNKSQHLSSVIDITRVNIFSIATQYKAIFPDDEIITNQNDLKNSLFHMWLTKRVNDFIAVVTQDLPHCPTSSFDSLLGQCMYFGQSFGRIGADFRGLVIKPFINVIEDNFRTAVRKVEEQFDINMKKFVLPRSISSNSINILRSEMENETQSLLPPSCLLEYPPLVEFCNGILTAFNNLRYCNPYACSLTVTTTIQKSLEKISSGLFSYYKKEILTWIDKEKEIFSNLCDCYTEKFIPFIQRCLTTLYDPRKITKFFGITIDEMKNENLVFLNVEKIRQCLTDSSYPELSICRKYENVSVMNSIYPELSTSKENGNASVINSSHPDLSTSTSKEDEKDSVVNSSLPESSVSEEDKNDSAMN